jgi:hypothetical protein
MRSSSLVPSSNSQRSTRRENATSVSTAFTSEICLAQLINIVSNVFDFKPYSLEIYYGTNQKILGFLVRAPEHGETPSPNEVVKPGPVIQ